MCGYFCIDGNLKLLKIIITQAHAHTKEFIDSTSGLMVGEGLWKIVTRTSNFLYYIR